MPGLLGNRSSTNPCGGLAMPKEGQWGSIEVPGGGGNGFALTGAAEAIVRVAPPSLMPKAPAVGGRVQSRKNVVSASGMLAVLVPRIVEPSAPVEIESTRRSSPLGVAGLGPALITSFRRTGGLT